MPNLIYNRQTRTASSEQFTVMDGNQRLGHLDIHYGVTDAYGTLVLEREFSDDEIAVLIEQINDDLVASSDVQGEDFFVHVYVGREVAVRYGDDLLADDIDPNSDPAWGTGSFTG
jgi:hypothetical protein